MIALYISLSTTADSIKFIGQNHQTLSLICNSDTASYTMKSVDPYVRITAYFPEGEVIYSNPFARYDSSLTDSPFNNETNQLNYTLTILFNLMLIAILAINIILFYKLMKK